jgi:acetyltransferase-like isoleucine patch superfamily enzyme
MREQRTLRRSALKLLQWIKRRDTATQRALYVALNSLAGARFPVIPGVHHLLAAERHVRRTLLSRLWMKIYHEPLLRLACVRCGNGLVLYEGMPKLMGSLRIFLGERVVLAGNQTWIAAGDPSPKDLLVGDDTYLGYGVVIASGNRVRFGSHVLVSDGVRFGGADGHPIDPLARARREPSDASTVGEIVIEDYAWIGAHALILKNVRVGRGAIIAAGSVVTKDVPELTVAGGNPAKVLRVLEPPHGWPAAAPPQINEVL